MASIDSAAAAGSAAAAAAGGAEDPSQDVYYLTDDQLNDCGVPQFNAQLLGRPEDPSAAPNQLRNRYLAMPVSSLSTYLEFVPVGKQVDLREVTYIRTSCYQPFAKKFMYYPGKIDSDIDELVKLSEIAPGLTSLRGEAWGIYLNKMSEDDYLVPSDQFTKFLNVFSYQLPQFMTRFYGRPDNLQYLLVFLDAATHMQFWNIHRSQPIGGLQGEGLDGKLPNLKELSCVFETVEDFIAMMEAAPNLEKLMDLAFQSPSKGMLAAALGDKVGRYSSVKKLDIICESWSSDDLKAVFEAMPNLEKVILRDNDPLDLEASFQDCPKYAYDGARLNLAAIPGSSLQHLEKISFYITLVRPCDVEALISHAPKLKKVEFASCRMIDGKAIGLLKETYTGITLHSAAAAAAAAAGGAAGAGAGAEAPSQDVYYLTDDQLNDCGVPQFNAQLLGRPEDPSAAPNQLRNRYLAMPVSSLSTYLEFVPVGKQVDLREVTYIDLSSDKPFAREFLYDSGKIDSDIDALQNLSEIAPRLTSFRGEDWGIYLGQMSEYSFLEFLRPFSHRLPQFMTRFHGRPDNLEYLLLFLDAATHMQFWAIHRSKPIGGLQGEGLDRKLPNLKELSCLFETVEDFIAMMEAAPNLEKLMDLAFQSPSKGMLAAALGDKVGRYSSVKKLDIICKPWSSDDLKAVFEAMPNLEKVILRDGERLNLTAIPEASLQHLEQITLCSSFFQPCDVEALISHAPKLKKVKLMFCKNPANIASLQEKCPTIVFEVED